ncbi:unnamed protein product, partial [Amoebophrya sp. A120]
NAAQEPWLGEPLTPSTATSAPNAAPVDANISQLPSTTISHSKPGPASTPALAAPPPPPQPVALPPVAGNNVAEEPRPSEPSV